MVFAKGLREPETPRLLSDNSWVCVEMVPPGSVTHITRDGNTITRIAEIERPNGLCVGQEDAIWVAATHPQPSLIKVTMAGNAEVFSTGPDDEPFLFPNDLCFGPDAKLYMTDSGILLEDWEVDGALRPDYKTAPFDGRVYQIDIHTGDVVALDHGIKFTNGIAFGAEGHLYANEMITGYVFRYSLGSNGLVGNREMVGNVMAPDWKGSGFRGPDGMAYGQDGNCYCSLFGQGDVTVMGPDGKHLQRIEVGGRFPTNVAFGPAGEQAIYVTVKETGTLERFDVKTSGAPIYHG